jgi:C_GCAxxG_C_C family probable redox protein
MSMNTMDAAEKLFREHVNCAQAVLMTLGGENGLDERTAQKIACGFGAGMARLQETCGAMTGACMALGLAIGNKGADPVATRDETYAAIREFERRFVALHGATSCRELLHVDLNTEEGRAAHVQYKLRDTVCLPCVRDAVRIVEELLKENV